MIGICDIYQIIGEWSWEGAGANPVVCLIQSNGESGDQNVSSISITRISKSDWVMNSWPLLYNPKQEIRFSDTII